MNTVELLLGIMTAVGGFVDISELVFAAQAGSTFHYSLIWSFAFSTIGMMVLGEMSGSVAAIAKQPVFSLMRHRLGLKLGLVTLLASLVSNLITCAAEIGGMAIILHLLTGFGYLLMAAASVLALIGHDLGASFKWIERTYGLLGLFMIVFAVALERFTRPGRRSPRDWCRGAERPVDQGIVVTFAYFTVAIISAVLFPYEAYFYSSGAIEEEWGAQGSRHQPDYLRGGFRFGLAAGDRNPRNVGATVRPAMIDPQIPAPPRWKPGFRSDGSACCSALLGMLFAVSGAAVETCVAMAIVARNIWLGMGASQEALGRAAFHLHLARGDALALAIVLSGIDPMKLVEYAIMFSILVLPLTYLPLLLLGGDRPTCESTPTAVSPGFSAGLLRRHRHCRRDGHTAVPAHVGRSAVKPDGKSNSSAASVIFKSSTRTERAADRRRYRIRGQAGRSAQDQGNPGRSGCVAWPAAPLGDDPRYRDCRRRRLRVPWGKVATIGSEIKLSCAARELGLMRRGRPRQPLRPAEGRDVIRLCDIYGKRVVGLDGTRHGRVHEVHAKDGAVDAIEIGVGSLVERMSGKASGRRVAWARVKSIGKDKIVIGD